VKIINNPINDGWFADPEAREYNGKYYIYVTQSFTAFEDQLNLSVFVSDDLVNWELRENIVEMGGFPWATKAIWAPTAIEQNGKYYLVFASNDIQSNDEVGGLELAVSDSPEGPFRACLKQPLVGEFVNGAQPIDAHLFKDDDGAIYLYFGGWGHCNVAVMNSEMTGFVPFEDGEIFKEITPDEYVEDPCMLKKDGLYYFMWSRGNWQNETYAVCYDTSVSPLGPFRKSGEVLKSDPAIANGPGHHGYLEIPNSDEWLCVYHRRPLDANEHGCRVVCIDKMQIKDGKIAQVKMTNQCILG